MHCYASRQSGRTESPYVQRSAEGTFSHEPAGGLGGHSSLLPPARVVVVDGPVPVVAVDAPVPVVVPAVPVASTATTASTRPAWTANTARKRTASPAMTPASSTAL